MRLIGIVLIFSIALMACKENVSNENEDDDTIEFESYEVDAFEVLTIVIPDYDLEDTYSATIGELEIELMAVTDTSLSVFVPNLPTNDYILNFELGEGPGRVNAVTISNPGQVANQLFTDFDDVYESAEINSKTLEDAKKVKDDLEIWFADLEENDKKEVIAYYQSNRKNLEILKKSAFKEPLSKAVQACEKQPPFKNYYLCVANQLGNTSKELKKALLKLAEMYALAAIPIIATPPNPISIGVSAFTVAFSTYMLWVEIAPAASEWWDASKEFLEANWILSQATFNYVTAKGSGAGKLDIAFESEKPLSLGVETTLRSINESDSDISPELEEFIDSYTDIKKVWDKFSILFEDYTAFNSDEETLELSNENISVSNISNADVELQNQNVDVLTFKNLSSDPLEFDFILTVQAEGFNQNYSFDATLTAFECSEDLTVRDQDGNEYGVVKVSGQCWLDSDLLTTTNNDGEKLRAVSNIEERGHSSVAYQSADYFSGPLKFHPIERQTEAENAGVRYGKQYNFIAAENNNICPQGWTVPDKDDFLILQSNATRYGTEPSAALKSIYQWSHFSWDDDRDDVNNLSGLSLLPNEAWGVSGWRDYQYIDGDAGYWWALDKEQIRDDRNLARMYLLDSEWNITVQDWDSFRIPEGWIADWVYKYYSIRCIKE